MSRRKPRVPFASVAAIPTIAIEPAGWSRIERGYGKNLRQIVRNKILDDTQSFVKFACFEIAAEPIEPAVKRLNKLRTCVQELHRLVDPALHSIRYPDAALYADELIGWRLYQKIYPPKQMHEYLAPFAKDVLLFERACALALDEINRTSKPGVWRRGKTWDEWIIRLTETLTQHDLPVSVRKDSDKNSTRQPSAFAKLILELQNFVPKEFRHYSTADAISQAIVRARRVRK
jgi:hypothetical protein